MNNNLIIFLVIILLIAGDKLTTYYSLKNLQKNNPNIDALSAEKNPMAKWFMQKLGLGWGNVLFSFVSIILAYLVIWGMQYTLKAFGVNNWQGIPYYVLFIIYAWTIANNLYFALKHGRIIP